MASLVGHQDYSFAVAWHPQGWLLATGNQDTTSLVWDMRYTSKPLAVLGGTMGAIRSLRFSPDGRWVAGWVVGCCLVVAAQLVVHVPCNHPTLCGYRPRPVTTT